MAQKAPPKEKKVAEKPPKAKRSPEDMHWSERLLHSGFFLGALLFHLILFLMIATWIIFPKFIPPSDDFEKAYVPAGSPPPPPPATSQPTMPVPTHNISPPTQVISTASTAPSFNIPMPVISPTTDLSKADEKITAPVQKSINGLASRLPGIKATVTGWGRDGNNIRNSNGDPHNVIAKFPVYLAKYAKGDWSCNTVLDKDGAIVAGSLPDLVEKINEWSRGNIKGEIIPTPLDIGGPDLMEKKPPFIFFTGHKDFILTDKEIENLRNYLQDGGAIWGDNALAGEGSRFDVAFRREMKRVIPDPDKNFEPFALTDDIFTKSWFPLSKVPQGMNYYQEPIQHIDIDGKLAILYTPNDYSDLYYMRILPGDTQIYVSDRPSQPLYTNYQFWECRDVFFRNFTLESSLAAHQLGMNIIGFLLVRFDKDLILTP